MQGEGEIFCPVSRVWVNTPSVTQACHLPLHKGGKAGRRGAVPYGLRELEFDCYNGQSGTPVPTEEFLLFECRGDQWSSVLPSQSQCDSSPKGRAYDGSNLPSTR